MLELLTNREREVLELIANRRTTAEISGQLFVSINTTETHVRHIREKLGVHGRREAAEIYDSESLVIGEALRPDPSNDEICCKAADSVKVCSDSQADGDVRLRERRLSRFQRRWQ